MLGRHSHFGHNRGGSQASKHVLVDSISGTRLQPVPSPTAVPSVTDRSDALNEASKRNVASSAQALPSTSWPTGSVLSDRVQMQLHGGSTAQDNSSHRQPNYSHSDNKELHLMVERTLGPGSTVWRTRQDILHGQRTTKMQQEVPPDATPSDIARIIGEFAEVDRFDAALQLMEDLLKQNQADALQLIRYKTFMNAAIQHKRPSAALAFLHTLPKRFHDVRLHNMALQVCAAGRDYPRALEVMDMVDKLRFKKDTKLLTSMINVCRSIGNAERAFKYFNDMKAENMQLDSMVYGALVAACAEAMLRELSVVHERKDQYVLLERAFQLVAEADATNVVLPVPAFNSLLVCAGRSGQLSRVFQVLDMMQARGLVPDPQTYGSMLESCVQAGRPELALKVFYKALSEGLTQHVELYTMAVSACKVEGAVDLEKAMGIYSLMQRNGVEADKKFFSALMAVAGKASRLDLALETVEDLAADGLLLSGTLANALIYASQQDLTLMRKVYDFCAAQGVYPQVSQYNRLMDFYASQARFGEVVSLICDMVHLAGQVPNLNTYRILINACQRADQAQLAIEVYATMRSKKIPILQKKFAQSLFYSLTKVCYNQIRTQWGASYGSDRPVPWKSAQKPLVRMQEAEKMLAALRAAGPDIGRATGGPDSAKSGRSGHQQAGSGMSLLSLAPESINWQQHAVMAYRDLVATGFKPRVEVVDMVLRCLRLKLSLSDESQPVASTAHAAGMPLGMGPGSNLPGRLGSHAGAHAHQTGMPRQPWEAPGATSTGPLGGPGPSADQAGMRGPSQRYETTFDRRALSILEDAMNKGHVPSIKGVEEGPSTIDLRNTPPALAELVVVAVLLAFEKRAVKTGRCQVFHNVTFLVPSFNPDFAMWPSYVEKLNRHYSLPDSAGRASRRVPASRDVIHADPASMGISAVGVSGHDHDGAKDQSEATGQPEEAMLNILHSTSDLQVPEGASGRSAQDILADLSVTDVGSTPLTAADATAAMSSSQAGGAPEEMMYLATATTSLAVAATCRRMKAYSTMDPERGVIALGSQELSRWLINRRSYELQQQPSSMAEGSPSTGAAAYNGRRFASDGQLPLAFRMAPSMMSMPEQGTAAESSNRFDDGKVSVSGSVDEDVERERETRPQRHVTQQGRRQSKPRTYRQAPPMVSLDDKVPPGGGIRISMPAVPEPSGVTTPSGKPTSS